MEYYLGNRFVQMVNIMFHNEYNIYCVHIYLMHILFLKRCEFSTWFNVSIHNLSSASEKTSQRGEGIFHRCKTLKTSSVMLNK